MTDPVPSKDLTWAPCPFCGGTDIRHDRHPRAGDRMHGFADVFSMCCYACGAQFPNCYSLARLNEQWNRRAAPEPAAEPAAWVSSINPKLVTADRVEASMWQNPQPLYRAAQPPRDGQ